MKITDKQLNHVEILHGDDPQCIVVCHQFHVGIAPPRAGHRAKGNPPAAEAVGARDLPPVLACLPTRTGAEEERHNL